MIKGISINETEEYVSKYDLGDNPTIWIIGVLDSLTMAEIRDMITIFENDEFVGTSKTKLKINVADAETVRHGLKGFKNFYSSNGTVIEFKTERRNMGTKVMNAVNDDVLRTIPLYIIRELAEVIRSKNVLSEIESKNSD